MIHFIKLFFILLVFGNGVVLAQNTDSSANKYIKLSDSVVAVSDKNTPNVPGFSHFRRIRIPDGLSVQVKAGSNRQEHAFDKNNTVSLPYIANSQEPEFLSSYVLWYEPQNKFFFLSSPLTAKYVYTPIPTFYFSNISPPAVEECTSSLWVQNKLIATGGQGLWHFVLNTNDVLDMYYIGESRYGRDSFSGQVIMGDRVLNVKLEIEAPKAVFAKKQAELDLHFTIEAEPGFLKKVSQQTLSSVVVKNPCGSKSSVVLKRGFWSSLMYWLIH